MTARSALSATDLATPAGRLMAALGLEPRATAEIQDLYSRPIVAIARISRPVRATADHDIRVAA
jgi:hypothetical protein